MPEENGSVTPRVAAVATAASTAFPPSRRTCSPTAVAVGSTLATAPPVPEEHNGSLAAVVRYAADPDHVEAEFGAVVRSDLQGLGLGYYLMERLIAYARADGLETLTGVMLRENGKMIDLATRLGFTTVDTPQPSGSTMQMSLRLEARDAAGERS